MKSVFDDELRHHGILGQKWGVRRFQNEDGSLKPAGERRYNGRDKKYVLGSASAQRRGSGLDTGAVGDRGFTGGGAGHSFKTNLTHPTRKINYVSGSAKAVARAHKPEDQRKAAHQKEQTEYMNREPQPIGSPEWWKWYENTPDREIAEKHYNMVIAKESRDRKRQERGVDAQRKTAHKQETTKDLVDRKKLVNRATKTVRKAANSVVSAISGAANAGKSFITNLLGKKG